MNMTIDELERRLYIQGRQVERSALLQFEAALEYAYDMTTSSPGPEDISDAPVITERTSL